jgi:hypothetical protein
VHVTRCSTAIRPVTFGAALLLAACAPGATARAVAGDAVTVVVRNDLRPETAVTVRLVSSAGVRLVLGSVPPNASRTMTADNQRFAGQYRLVVEGADGREVQSSAFTLLPNARVTWGLFANSLVVSGER